MIRGHKASGYFVTGNGDGCRVEGETRQCCHCQFVWESRPGSGTRRGWCLKHSGFLCGREECALEQKRMVDNYAASTGKLVSCLAFEEWNDFLGEQLHNAGNAYTVTAHGVIVPKDIG